MSETTKEPKELNPFVLLTFMVIVAALLTYVVPAGKFKREADPSSGKVLVVKDSYQPIEQTPVKIQDVFLAFPNGMVAAGILIFGMFVAGGAFRILEDMGTINAFINFLVGLVKGREIMLIPVVMAAFAIGGTAGIISPVIIFMPLGLVITRSLGFDSMVAMGMVYLGVYAAFDTSPVVPTSVGIAHQIGQIPLFSGAGPRSIICLTTIISSIAYVSWYALRVKKDPSKSLVKDINAKFDFDIKLESSRKMTQRDWLVLGVTTLSILALVVGSVKYQWEFMEISALFIFMAIVTGLVGGMSVNATAESFVKGMAGITNGAMIIGFAYAVQYVLNKGNILDTIIFHLSNVLVGLSPSLAAISMFFVNCFSAFLITSGSGQAAAVMPIMYPIGDLLGVTRQVSAQAFLFADGFMNGLSPTSGMLMAALAIAKVPFGRWLKFHIPLFLIWVVIAIVSLVLGVHFHWGP